MVAVQDLLSLALEPRTLDRLRFQGFSGFLSPSFPNAHSQETEDLPAMWLQNNATNYLFVLRRIDPILPTL